MSRNKQKMAIPFTDPAAREYVYYLERRQSRLEKRVKRLEINDERHEQRTSLRPVITIPYEEKIEEEG